MKHRTLLLVMAIISLTALSITDAEARHKRVADKKQTDRQLAWYVDIVNPSNAVYDSVSNGYYITSYGKAGYYPHIFAGEIDSSKWDGEVNYISNEDQTKYKLPIKFISPTGCEIIGDTLFVADCYSLFLINLNNDSTIRRILMPTNSRGLTDMIKDTSGNLYISSFQQDSIFKYNLTTRQFTRLQTTGIPFDSIASMVFEPRDNAIYFGTYTYRSKIMKLNLATLVVSLAKQTNMPYISGMDTDGDGNLYVAQYPADDNIHSAPITKFNRNFTGDSVEVIPAWNDEINNIYFNKIENTLVLNCPRKGYTSFVKLDILKDTVKLVYPKNNAVNVETSVEFRFNKLITNDDVKFYELNYSLSPNYSQGGKTITLSQKDTSVIVNYLKRSTTYYWHVRASNGEAYSPWCPIRSFTTIDSIIVPTAIYPTDSMKNVYSNVNFRWTAGNAKKFIFRLYTDRYAKDLFKELNLDTNAVMIDDINTYRIYYWMVKAVGDSGASNWSRFYTFETDTPRLEFTMPIRPENGVDSIETSADFLWTQVPNATHYIFKLYKVDGAEWITKVHIDTNAYTVSTLDTGAFYTWYVKAYNSQYTSGWNDYNFQFSTNSSNIPPPMINPVSSDGKPVDVNPIFTWQNTNAQSYKLQLAEIKKDPKTGIETADFIHPVYASESIESTQLKLPTNLKNSAKYEWKVKAVYDKKRRSGWSKTSNFETKAIVSVNNPKMNDEFEVYPNPVHDFIEISVGANGRSPLQSDIKIFNIFGQTVLSVGIQNLESLRVDVSGLAQGMYFVRIGDMVRKFVKI